MKQGTQTSSDSENTVVGVYDNYSDAKGAVEALIGAGFSRSRIQLNPESDSAGTASMTQDQDSGGIGGFFRSLFGGNDQDEQYRDVYSESVRRGHYVLTVNAQSQHDVGVVTDIMNRFNAVDIDERASHWKSQGWSNYDDSAPRYTNEEITADRASYSSQNSSRNLSGEKRIPVVEEEMKIGKREVERGGVRVFSRVRETPVNESVQLREEHVKVERNPVNKSASQADMNAFKEESIELREKSEEPVVSKSARVVEEVVVKKEATERTEKINDTVRRTDVEVENLSASNSARSGTMYDTEFRDHWKTNFGSSGGRYEDYEPAYNYGSSMASSDRYRDAQWDEMEPQLRSDWEATHPGSKWDKVKDAVRYGSQRGSGTRR